MSNAVYKVIGGAGAVAATAVAEKALHGLWRGVTGTTPPTALEDPETDWRQALAWAALSGAVIGLARLAVTRQATRYYVNSTGHLPKSVKRTSVTR